jgi:hypothetical protein
VNELLDNEKVLQVFICQNDGCFTSREKLSVINKEGFFQERSTINILLSESQKSPEYHYIYFHSKSVTKPGNEAAIGYAKTLINFLRVIIDGFSAISQKGYNTAGGNLVTAVFEHFDGIRMGYSGNFWVATGRYLQTIPHLNSPENAHYRHDAEYAISQGKEFMPFNLFSLFFHPDSEEILDKSLNPYLENTSNLLLKENDILPVTKYRMLLAFTNEQLNRIIKPRMVSYSLLLYARMRFPVVYNVVEKILYKFYPEKRKYFFVFHPGSVKIYNSNFCE